ncbi:MAG: outer-membrane lipoprotein carrier protein LolA [Paracoccaceae bacterium]|nr:outer-membrane lipoprotein carrier protein LolA [Paracoccaceae bacterium]
MKIFYRFYLLIFFLPTVVAADLISLEKLTLYINSIKTLEANFEQINNDNSLSAGNLLIKKPGKLRMEYEGPNDSVVLVSSGFVTIFDLQSNAPPLTFPLEKTPFRILLFSDLSLEKVNMGVDFNSERSKTILTIKNLENQNEGYIEMTFRDNPIVLEQWLLVNSMAEQIIVKLTNVSLGANMSNNLFNTTLELERIKNNR